MARISSFYVCSVCGAQTPKWQGQCPHCETWNSLEKGALATPAVRAAPAASAHSLAAVAVSTGRLGTGQDELDRVLGGGLVAGSVALLGGDPGIGKSTLLLQVAAHVGRTRAVLYA
ncbi:MAG TPA: AAA family ATPase, partial [Steroidobacteraceae bacterium]